MLTILLVGCVNTNNARLSCPDFPIPSEAVQQKFDALADQDREVWEWGNKLLDLCQQLGTCEKEEGK